MLSLGNLTAAIGRSYAIKARLKREQDAAEDALDRKHEQAKAEFEIWRQGEEAKRAVQREWVLQREFESQARVAFEAEQELRRKAHAKMRRLSALKERAAEVEAERLALKAAEPRIYRVGVPADLAAFNTLSPPERQKAMKEKRVKG